MGSNHTKPPYTPVWPGPAPRRAGASGLLAELPGRFSGGARPTRLSLHGRPAPLTRPFYAWPHPAFLCIPKHRRGAGVYTPSWASCITQKLTDCDVWTLAAAGLGAAGHPSQAATDLYTVAGLSAPG